MKTRKVQELINLLSEEEKQDFLRWLEYDLNGNQSSTFELAVALVDQQPISLIWPRIYPDKPVPEDPYRDSGLRRMESHVSTRVEAYMALNLIRQDSVLMEWKLIEELNRRDADRVFVNRYKKAVRDLEHQPLIDATNHLLRYRLEREWRYYLLKNGKRKELTGNLERINQSMEAWWLHEKLRAELMNVSGQSPAGNQGQLIHELLDLIEQQEFLRSLPLLNIYCDLYRLLSTGDLNLEPAIHDWLKLNHKKLKPDVVQDIFNILHNFLVRNFNHSAQQQYVEALWKLHEWGIQIGIFLQDGILPPARYRNLMEIGLRVNAVDKVWNYLLELKQLLPKESREEEFRFNLGGYYAKTGDFSMASRTLGQKFSEPQMEISARMKLLRMRYEQGERDELEYELRALREYCRRHGDIHPDHRRNAENEIKIFQRLVRVFGKIAADKLVARIHTTSPLVSRKWFLEQAELISPD